MCLKLNPALLCPTLNLASNNDQARPQFIVYLKIMSATDNSTESGDDESISTQNTWEREKEALRVDPGFPERRPLPSSTVIRGTPVWEPPEIYCDDLIGEEYEKMRKAMLDFTSNDVAKTTEYLDWYMQTVMDGRYVRWARNQYNESKECGDDGSAYFYHGLMTELQHDEMVFYDEGHRKMAIILYQVEEEYYVECYDPFAEMWGGDPRIIRKMEEDDERRRIRRGEVEAENEAKRREEEAEARNTRGRLVAQDDDAEGEEMEWLRSRQPTHHQSANMKPLILRLLPTTIRNQENRDDAEAHGSGEELD